MADTLDKLKSLIAASHGSDAADSWARTSLSEEDRALLQAVGLDLLKHFPTMPGACAMMSALYVSMLEKKQAKPAYVMMGSLYADGIRVFGEDGDFDGREKFLRDDPSWDGHAWIVSGDTMSDTSLFRTAYSKGSPPALKAFVETKLGKGRGLMSCPVNAVEELGLRYEAKYVLTTEQVDGVARGALQRLKELSRR